MKPCARQDGMKETCCRLRCTCMMMILENQFKFMNIYNYQARRINDKKNPRFRILMLYIFKLQLFRIKFQKKYREDQMDDFVICANVLARIEFEFYR